MKILGGLSFLMLVLLGTPAAYASPEPDFCKVLRAFVGSVQPGQTREFTFRASWGSNFKDATESALAAKRCTHNGYGPAEKVCAYLMEYGSTEFTGADVKDAVSCLSRKTKFDRDLNLNEAFFSFSYGSDNRGALIDVSFKPDATVGGVAFRLVADGY